MCIKFIAYNQRDSDFNNINFNNLFFGIIFDRGADANRVGVVSNNRRINTVI